MVPERVAHDRAVLTTGRGAGIFLDWPIGQLWSDFDDFYSIGKPFSK